MYNQLIYFVIALLLFAMEQPGDKPLLPPLENFFLGASCFLFFVLICHLTFRRLKLAVTDDFSRSVLMARYLAAQRRLSILALANLAVDVYACNIKYTLRSLPGFEQSLTLAGLTGLGLFLLHLGVIWAYSYPIYQHIYHSRIRPAGFLWENLAFSTAILVPWFLIAIISDILQLLTLPTFLQSEAGQFLLTAGLLIACLLFAPRLVVRLWGCRALPMNALRGELEEFAQAHHFKVGNFMLWPLFGGETLTAGIIGILPKWRYILITRGLLGLLNSDELKAVVAHEMGHARRYHMLFFLAFFLCYSILAYTFNDLAFLALLQNPLVLDWVLSSESVNTTLLSILHGAPMILLLVVYFRYIFGFFLRHSERQADLYALKVIGHPMPLVSSLQRIAFHSGHTEDLPNWHHFSIRQRIEFLLKASEDPGVVRRHHTRYYSAVAIFFLLVAGLSTLGFKLESSKFIHDWQAGLRVAIIEREFARLPENQGLYAAYGSLLLERGDFAKAEVALKKSLESLPEDATTLNNLAWLYATSPPPYFKPEAALELALRAEKLEQAPYILDTLAEAYYVNGQAEAALATIREALLKEPKNRDYFLTQERKFEAAAADKKERRGKGWKED
jgi:Zn-dependent protease with chaperone function